MSGLDLNPRPHFLHQLSAVQLLGAPTAENSLRQQVDIGRVPARVPPIQFCERHRSPGCLPVPRTPFSKSLCASHINRTLIGKPLGSLKFSRTSL